ncbi:MAG: heat shock protein HspQ [Gammaproteobacteria bacterium]|nr:heat shock protein HspQ [Gammaproteobacteria bacterium]
MHSWIRARLTVWPGGTLNHAEFGLPDEWYRQVARSHPPKEEPWYQVLVDTTDRETYVVQRNLEADTENEPISHPRIQECFYGFKNGVHQVRGAN